MTDKSFEWDRQKVKKVLEVLKNMEDFDRLPLPMEIHKAFDIPLNKPRADNMMKYVESCLRKRVEALPAETRQTPLDTKFPEFNYGKTVYPELELEFKHSIDGVEEIPQEGVTSVVVPLHSPTLPADLPLSPQPEQNQPGDGSVECPE
jgi:hypothetical protein